MSGDGSFTDEDLEDRVSTAVSSFLLRLKLGAGTTVNRVQGIDQADIINVAQQLRPNFAKTTLLEDITEDADSWPVESTFGFEDTGILFITSEDGIVESIEYEGRGAQVFFNITRGIAGPAPVA